MVVQLSKSEKIILTKICQLQAESYNRLANNDSGIDVELYAIGIDIKYSEIKNEMVNQALIYTLVSENPHEVFCQGYSFLSLIKHTLLNYEDELGADPKALKDLWYKLFLATFILEREN